MLQFIDERKALSDNELCVQTTVALLSLRFQVVLAQVKNILLHAKDYGCR